MWQQFVVVAVCVGLGNFAYEAVVGRRWARAWERTYFQAAALGLAYFTLH